MNKIIISILCMIVFIIVGCSGGGNSNVVVKHEKPLPVNNIKASDNHLGQAKVAYVKDKYKQTIKHAEKAISLNHKNWEAYYYLGLALQKRRDYAVSVDAFKNGLKHAPDNRFVRSELHFSIGYSWEQIGHLDRAKKAYATALEFNSDNIDAHQGRNRIKIEKTLKGWGKNAKSKTDG